MIELKKVIFYPNNKDDEICTLACMRSALEYFDNRKYELSKLRKLTGFQPGRAAWTVKAWTELAASGYDIKMIENFDYRRYADEGIDFLQSFFNSEELEYQLEHTNLTEIKPLIPEFLQKVNQLQRSPTLQDIDAMLNDNYLVTIQLNSRALNDKPGYYGHMVLALKKDGDDYIIHDPGLPPHPFRKVSRDKIYTAMGGENNTVEVTGIKK